MRNIVLIFAALLVIGSIYWFSESNIFKEIAEEIIEKEIEIEKETSK